ncbi:MAG: DinB family protein [Bacteroidetes bacterium]|nr:MAG: DinB family protein [Bacteroidota bacterium]
MNDRPQKGEFDEYYEGYINLVPEADLRSALIDSGTELVRMFGHHETNLSLSDHRYEPSKWTVSQVLLHLIDAENVFLNRALWAARQENSPLPGYNHNAWVESFGDRVLSVSSMIQWFRIQRQNTVMFFEHLEDSDYDLSCEANHARVTVRALGYIIAGHTRHHANILKERYLQMQ